jgi:hypothetical protein
MANRKSASASRPNADEPRKAGQPRYQPVEQALDEEITEAHRQPYSTNPADDVPPVVPAREVDQEDSEERGEEERKHEVDNGLTPDHRIPGEDSNETSGGRRPGKKKGTRGGDSPPA